VCLRGAEKAFSFEFLSSLRDIARAWLKLLCRSKFYLVLLDLDVKDVFIYISAGLPLNHHTKNTKICFFASAAVIAGGLDPL